MRFVTKIALTTKNSNKSVQKKKAKEKWTNGKKSVYMKVYNSFMLLSVFY